MAHSTYESMIILNPNLEKEALATLVDGFKEIVARRAGSVIAERDLGKKKFAYPVKKFSTGYYYLLFFSSPAEVVFELERSYKHSEDVLKFLTIRLGEKELKQSLAFLESPAPAPAAPVAAKEEADGQLQ